MFGQKDRRVGFIVELNCGAVVNILDLKPVSVHTRVPPSVGPEFRLDASIIRAVGLVANNTRAAVEIGYKWPNPQALDRVGIECYWGQSPVLFPAKMTESCKPNHKQNRDFIYILDPRRVLQMNPARVGVTVGCKTHVNTS